MSGSATATPLHNFVRASQSIVTVSISYRLSAFGFFAHPSLSAESGEGEIASSGNYGFQDQVEALRWVKNNIRAYGGDPNQVTIAGERSHTHKPNERGETACLGITL